MSSQKIIKGWKPCDSRQDIARQERLNYSRNCKGHVHNEDKNMIIDECDSNDSLSMIENEADEFEFQEDEATLSDFSAIQEYNIDLFDGDGNNTKVFKTKNNKQNDNDSTSVHSCISQSSGINKLCENESEANSYGHSFYKICPSVLPIEIPCSQSSKPYLNSKRQLDEDNDGPKPKKIKMLVDEHIDISSKYSSESLCGIDDLLPDGFYDAGRDRPFRPLQNYLKASCMDSREIILLDRSDIFLKTSINITIMEPF